MGGGRDFVSGDVGRFSAAHILLGLGLEKPTWLWKAKALIQETGNRA